MILMFQAVTKMADIVFSVRLNPLSLHPVKLCVILSWEGSAAERASVPVI